jgi:hypothetical protein
MSSDEVIRSLRGRRHFYFSTACRHELHDRCLLTCKWCGAPCMCRCHRGDEPPPHAA